MTDRDRIDRQAADATAEGSTHWDGEPTCCCTEDYECLPCQDHAQAARSRARRETDASQQDPKSGLWYCGGESCPGYGYRASDLAHPASCALPRDYLAEARCMVAGADTMAPEIGHIKALWSLIELQNAAIRDLVRGK